MIHWNRYGMDLNGSRRKNATRETTATLKAWLSEHKKNPYPTKGEKIMLAIITKMTLTQVSTWFANARRRLKKENKMTWEPKNRNDDGDDDDDDDSDAEPSKDHKRSSSGETLCLEMFQNRQYTCIGYRQLYKVQKSTGNAARQYNYVARIVCDTVKWRKMM